MASSPHAQKKFPQTPLPKPPQQHPKCAQLRTHTSCAATATLPLLHAPATDTIPWILFMRSIETMTPSVVNSELGEWRGPTACRESPRHCCAPAAAAARDAGINPHVPSRADAARGQTRAPRAAPLGSRAPRWPTGRSPRCGTSCPGAPCSPLPVLLRLPLRQCPRQRRTACAAAPRCYHYYYYYISQQPPWGLPNTVGRHHWSPRSRQRRGCQGGPATGGTCAARETILPTTRATPPRVRCAAARHTHAPARGAAAHTRGP